MALIRRASGHLCRLALAAVFLTAGLLKSLDPEALARETAQYGLLPEAMTLPFAYLLIPLEIVVGVSLLLDWRRALSMTAACALMLVFIGAIGFAIVADRPLEACGCFGRHVPRTPAQTLTEDIGFLVAGLFGLWALRQTREEAVRGGSWKGAAVAAVAVASASFTLASPRLPIDDLATALSPGVVWSDLGVAVAERDFTQGRHFVALLGLKDEASGASVASINELAGAPGDGAGWETTGLYAGDDEALVEFTFMRGPAFPLYQTTASDMKRLHRRLPRFFSIELGRVTRTWSRLPDPAAVRDSFAAPAVAADGSAR